ncbi:unnamed protein product [Notodromas monacha]|uniref:Uncharacterized protein n=1 Tax=Notodromas monacha TaxID=399045 RepID=A0A7R9BMZ6_9CRUS|nr:unnamed protein product [Notodromas monacha]CAG0917664.1 unnamed protein product [Notodromas monacha]
MGEGRMSRNLTSACWLSLISCVVVIIAFSTPAWVENDGMLPNPKFIRSGLWEVCLEYFEDPEFEYDRKFLGCYWIFNEELHFISDVIHPPFLTATQTFFTFSFVVTIFMSVGVIMFNFFCPPDREILALRIIGSGFIGAGVCGTIAVIIFGALGDSRDFMPHWEHNYLSWSFAFAVVAVILEIIAGTMFLVEMRRFMKRLSTSSGGPDPSSTAQVLR